MRITDKQLESVVSRINRATKSPMEPWVQTKDGKLVAQIGNYHLDHAYGGVSLHRMSSTGGGVSDVLSCGHVTKGKLYALMHAFIRGLESK